MGGMFCNDLRLINSKVRSCVFHSCIIFSTILLHTQFIISGSAMRRSGRFRTRVLNFWDFEKISRVKTDDGEVTTIVQEVPGEGTLIVEPLCDQATSAVVPLQNKSKQESNSSGLKSSNTKDAIDIISNELRNKCSVKTGKKKQSCNKKDFLKHLKLEKNGIQKKVLKKYIKRNSEDSSKSCMIKNANGLKIPKLSVSKLDTENIDIVKEIPTVTRIRSVNAEDTNTNDASMLPPEERAVNKKTDKSSTKEILNSKPHIIDMSHSGSENCKSEKSVDCKTNKQNNKKLPEKKSLPAKLSAYESRSLRKKIVNQRENNIASSLKSKYISKSTKKIREKRTNRKNQHQKEKGTSEGFQLLGGGDALSADSGKGSSCIMFKCSWYQTIIFLFKISVSH